MSECVCVLCASPLLWAVAPWRADEPAVRPDVRLQWGAALCLSICVDWLTPSPKKARLSQEGRKEYVRTDVVGSIKAEEHSNTLIRRMSLRDCCRGPRLRIGSFFSAFGVLKPLSFLLFQQFPFVTIALECSLKSLKFSKV